MNDLTNSLKLLALLKAQDSSLYVKREWYSLLETATVLNVSCCRYRFQQYLLATTFPFPALHRTNNIQYLKSKGLPVGFLWIQMFGI